LQDTAFDALSDVAAVMLLLTLQVAQAWKWALVVHVLSWYMQIHPGHAILEGRKPALLDSLVQVRGKGQQQRCAACCVSTCSSSLPPGEVVQRQQQHCAGCPAMYHKQMRCQTGADKATSSNRCLTSRKRLV
jgi:hypothetical protein